MLNVMHDTPLTLGHDLKRNQAYPICFAVRPNIQSGFIWRSRSLFPLDDGMMAYSQCSCEWPQSEALFITGLFDDFLNSWHGVVVYCHVNIIARSPRLSIGIYKDTLLTYIFSIKLFSH